MTGGLIDGLGKMRERVLRDVKDPPEVWPLQIAGLLCTDSTVKLSALPGV